VAVVARALALAVAIGATSVAAADPAAEISAVLRDGNLAATAGDWPTVARLVDPVLRRPLAAADLAEAHRLAGLAAFFQHRLGDAEAHFLGYLRVELDGRLDPALYPPEVVGYFNDVASRHSAELRALRPRPRGSWLLNLVPPAGQLQNGERTKGYVLGALLGGLLVTNVASYLVLRAWCSPTVGPGGGAVSCDGAGDHRRGAAILRPINLAAGAGFLLTYAFGVYDGVQGYRQRSTRPGLQPFVAISSGAHVFGIAARF
jgi:hypothetical protein